jgi:amidase
LSISFWTIFAALALLSLIPNFPVQNGESRLMADGTGELL